MIRDVYKRLYPERVLVIDEVLLSAIALAFIRRNEIAPSEIEMGERKGEGSYSVVHVAYSLCVGDQSAESGMGRTLP